MPLTHWRNTHGDFFRSARVLVTGGAGFIGSHMTEALVELGAHVVVLDDLSGGSTENFDTFRATAGARLEFVKASILDADALRQATRGCRYVFHFAALGSVPGSVEQPVRYCDVNINGTLRVLEAAREAGVKRVMFAASSAAYGDAPELPKRESMPTAPKSPYAASKVAGEALLQAYAGSYPALDTAPLRFFNIFGPRQNANSAYAAVIAAFAKAFTAGKHPIIFGDGEQSRDFCFVENVVHANLLAARSEKRIDGRIANVAVGESITVNQLALLMAKLYGRPELTPVHNPERAGDVKHSSADLSVARSLLGYKPVVSFADGLRPTVEWYKQVLAAAAK